MYSPIFRTIRCVLLATTILVAADAAQGQTPPLCPDGATGSCTLPHSTPGCADATCCELVCAFDAFCCIANWDAYCAYVIAPSLCTTPPPVPCGQPSSGPCDQVHATPSCSDATCCEYVCTAIPTCCSVGWDTQCVTLAANGCSSQCDPVCPSSSLAESELCGEQANPPCLAGVPNPALQSLGNGSILCGKLQWVNPETLDIDAYRVVVTDPNDDLLARVTLSFAAKAPAFLALVTDPCAPLASAPIHAQIDGCVPSVQTLCVQPGAWYAIVARGTFPTPEEFPEQCGSFQRYVLQVSWNDQCTDPCGTGGDCYGPHLEPGCDTPACCSQVCAVDPLCCEKSWDELCVERALTLCNPTPPLNDSCQTPRPIGLGSQSYSLAGATPSTQAVPSGCLTLGGTSVGADVWFALSEVEGTITVSTCAPGSIDTVLLAYETLCDSAPVACDDDNPQCSANSNSSTISFPAVCGTRYLIRVASAGSQAGSGALLVSSTLPPCPPCLADLNLDETVDGIDLSVVLSGWGLPGQGDIDGSGMVDGFDLTAILSGWGDCP
ncbi:MAG: hypothetical protein EXS03_00175 [Phycisphaerales bacterium]|nr:hypothetical protein [Phycisphaerales bacterium]